MKELADLFLTFCRIGGLTFGGGYAMLPMIQQEVVEKRKWATNEEVMDYTPWGSVPPESLRSTPPPLSDISSGA